MRSTCGKIQRNKRKSNKDLEDEISRIFSNFKFFCFFFETCFASLAKDSRHVGVL